MQYFVVVAEELHFGRAAERLHIAQPSLSHQIRRLEQQLGVALLERTSRRVELTPAGRTLLTEGRRFLTQSQRAVRITRAAGSEGLTVGFYGSAASELLPRLLRVFAERHPAVEVSLRDLLLGRIDDILAGNVDVAFTRLLPGQAEVEVEVLAREPRLVALPTNHSLADRTSLSFAELRQETFITNPAIEAGEPAIQMVGRASPPWPPGARPRASRRSSRLSPVAAGSAWCQRQLRITTRGPTSSTLR